MFVSLIIVSVGRDKQTKGKRKWLRRGNKWPGDIVSHKSGQTFGNNDIPFYVDFHPYTMWRLKERMGKVKGVTADAESPFVCTRVFIAWALK